MVAAHKSRQIEGLGRRIDCHSPILRILRNRLCRYMFVCIQNNVRPDFIRNDKHIISFENIHGLFQLPALPHTPGRIVRRTRDSYMNLLLFDFSLHVLIVHAPDTVFILYKIAVNNVKAVVRQGSSKSNICWCMNQHLIPL